MTNTIPFTSKMCFMRSNVFTAKQGLHLSNSSMTKTNGLPLQDSSTYSARDCLKSLRIAFCLQYTSIRVFMMSTALSAPSLIISCRSIPAILPAIDGSVASTTLPMLEATAFHFSWSFPAIFLNSAIRAIKGSSDLHFPKN